MSKKLILTSLLAGALLAFYFYAERQTVSVRADAAAAVKNEEAIEKLKIDGEFDSLSKALTAARYSFNQNGEKFEADNPAQKMSAQFERDGSFELSVAAENNTAFKSAWRLKSIGRGQSQSAVGSGNWQMKGNRAELRREEIGLTEYFENRADALEQGFILDTKPSGEENLRLVLQTGGDLRAEASADGQTIRLFNNEGIETLSYEKLKVWDAQNKIMAARMTTDTTGEIGLEVEDANAVYPLTIDPSFVQQLKLTRPDSTTQDHFGAAISEDSPFLAIGAPDADVNGNADQGAVYIFERENSAWIFRQKLTASDGAAGDNFGSSVEFYGSSKLWIGAPNDDIGLSLDQGSVYRFDNTTASVFFSQSLKVLSTDGAAGDNFGSDIVKESGVIGTIFVAAPNDDVNGNAEQGSVYWINANNGGHLRRLNANDGAAGDRFGSNIDVLAYQRFQLIVGAPRDDNGSQTDQGSVYILEYDVGANSWTQTQKILDPNGALGDNFGGVVYKNDSNELFIGAVSDDVDGNSGEGSVYYYEFNNGVYSYNTRLNAADGAPFDRFGSSISFYSFFDSVLVVGSPFADIGGRQNQGAVYTFKKQTVNGNVTFRQDAKITPRDGQAGDNFGAKVLLLNNRDLFVSSPNDDVDADVDQGSVSVMRRPAEILDFDGDNRTDIGIFRPSAGEWWLQNSNLDSVSAVQFGQSGDVMTPGDYTGDGRTDIAFFRPSSGTWFVLRSEDNTFYGFTFGSSADIPAPADFDGDSKTDPAVYRQSNATWYIQRSTGGTSIQQFGTSNDLPVPADYDGDSVADIAIFRPNGASGGAEWWISRTSSGVLALQFGTATDKTVVGDYTGDGKADIAFWRPSTGQWFVLRSQNSTFYAFPLGGSGDIPVPGNYDSDGIMDAAVFRPSEANWYLLRSSAGVQIRQFGFSTDRPIANAFVR